jgi:thiamine biosynthesis lipoprotein
MRAVMHLLNRRPGPGVQMLAPVLAVCLVSAAVGATKQDAAADAAGEEWHSESRDLYYRIRVAVTYFPARPELTTQVWNYLEAADDVFNDFKPASEVSRINRLPAAGEVLLSPALEEAFAKSFYVYRLSDGMFDITCAPLRSLWRRARNARTVPTEASIEAARQTCGMHLAEQEGNRLRVRKAGVQFDFGGIAKGIFVDHAVAMLKAGGARSALVQVGGETAAFGLSPRGQPFRIAVQHPLDRTNTWCVFRDPGQGVSGSTSGNYEQPIVVDGQTFYHIFNVRTGRPADTSVLSVSIVFPTTGKNWLADGLCKPGVLLGPEKTFRLLKDLDGEALFLVLENGRVRAIPSPGWSRFE